MLVIISIGINNNKELISNIPKFKRIISNKSMKTGAIFTKYVSGSSLIQPKYFWVL